MIKRGGASFAILFIVNPIVILFYQNCSVIPVHSKAKIMASTTTTPSRQIASVEASDSANSCRYLSSSQPCAE